jgi:hypothetical protein
MEALLPPLPLKTTPGFGTMWGISTLLSLKGELRKRENNEHR